MKTGGRVAGTPNKATGIAREAIARFVDENSHRLTEWLDQIAKDDPKAAFSAFMSVVEYHIPKLQRLDQKTEFTDRPTINIIRFADDPKILEQSYQKNKISATETNEIESDRPLYLGNRNSQI